MNPGHETAISENAVRSRPTPALAIAPHDDANRATARAGRKELDVIVEVRVDEPDDSHAALDLTRAAALAAAVEALTSGPARVLAAELRELLDEARTGASDVTSLAAARARRLLAGG